MSRPSSIGQLPPEIRELIGKLRQRDWTIDQIREHLAKLLDSAPSRSALGRHIHGLDVIAEKMRRSRTVAEALVQQLGDEPESRTARLNIELLHSALLDLFMRAAEGDDGNDVAGSAALAGNPEGMMMLAKALDHLGRASKSNVDVIERAEKRAAERAKREAVAAVEEVARDKDRGISAETLEAIKWKIFGVKT